MNLVDEVGTLLDTTSPIFESYAEAYCTEVRHLKSTEILIYFEAHMYCSIIILQ